MSVTEGRSAGGVGTIDVPITIANTGSAACTLTGYPGVLFVTAGGSSSPPVTHDGRAPAFRAAHSTVTLPAGSGPSAGFVLEYSDEQINGDTCTTLTGISVAVGTGGGSVAVSRGFDPCGPVGVSAIVSASEATAS